MVRVVEEAGHSVTEEGMFPGVGVPVQLLVVKVNSSSPISGVAGRVLPSMSVVIPAILTPLLSNVDAEVTRCRSVVETNEGFEDNEFASLPVPFCHAARFTRSAPPMRPRLGPVK